MQYRYRVVGKVTKPFILRGAYFVKGSEIEFYITKNELDFVKERCELEKVEDLQVAKTDNPVSKSNKAQNKPSTAQDDVDNVNTQPEPQTPSKRQYTKRTSVSNNK